MIMVLSKRIFRLTVAVLLLLFILPVIHYYALRAMDPQAVHFQKPRGEALKVSANVEDNEGLVHIFPRFLHYVHEFYQNGL